MAETKKAAPGKRIIDVAHPGKSSPSPSSKPVIVTNRPILKDPMMVDDSEKATSADSVPVTVSRKVEINPKVETTSSDETKTDATSADSKPEETKTIAQLAEEAKARVDKAEADKKAAEEAEVAQQLAKKDDLSVEDKPSSDASTPGAEAAADEEAKLAEDEKHDEALQKLVESKQYFLSINALEKRRTKRFVVLGILLSVLLAIAWADIALDAGIVQIPGVKPVTHFFSN